MKEFMGTKGEWIYLQDLGEVVSKPSGIIADLVVNGGEDHNGKLIAAAPQLLEALQKMFRAGQKQNWNERYESEMNASRAAISKALGEE